MGFIDRLRGKADAAQEQKAGDDLERQFLLFQQQALQYVRNCRKALEENDRKSVVIWAEKFNKNYRDFTAKKNLYQALGKPFYDKYQDMVNALGPIYEAVNGYVTGTAKDTQKIIGWIDNNSRFVAEVKIERRKAA